MLNIGLGELLVVLLIAYVIVGPRDLPNVARWLGRQVRRIRRAGREFRELSGWDELVSAGGEAEQAVKDAAKEADPAGLTEEISGKPRDREP